MSATALIRCKNRLSPQGLNSMGENTPDFATNLTLWKGTTFFYIRYLDGGCAGSLERTALRLSNSLITGKIEGMSSFLALFAHALTPEPNRLAVNSLASRTGNFPEETGRVVFHNGKSKRLRLVEERTFRERAPTSAFDPWRTLSGHPSPIERRPSHSRESWIPVSELGWRGHDHAIICSD